MEPAIEEHERSLPRLLVALHNQGFTGRADIFEPGGTSAVFYRRGRVVKVQRPDRLDRLADVLVQSRLVSAEAVTTAARLYGDSETDLARALSRTSPGGPDTIRAGIRLQLARQLTRAFFSDDPRVVVTAGEHRFFGASSPGGAEIDPRTLIFPAIRATHDDARLSRQLGSMVRARLRLVPVSTLFLRQAGFRQQDQGTLHQLGTTGVEVDDAWLRAPADPRGSSPKAVVLALHCLDLLDVQRGAIRGDSPADPIAHKHTGVTGLHRLDPATVARRAEMFFKNGEMTRAERAFRIALRSDPQNGRASAFLAWLEFWHPSTDRAARLPEATRAMKEAVDKDRQFAYGHYFLGALQKIANDAGAATRSFAAAVSADTSIVEAQRELRLLAARRTRGRSSTGG